LSKVSWEANVDFESALEKAMCSFHDALKQLLHITARGFREICENSQGF
jgi:hypothetical protein